VSDSRDLAGQIGGQFADPAHLAAGRGDPGRDRLHPGDAANDFPARCRLAFWLWHSCASAQAAAPMAEAPPPPIRASIALEDVSDHTLVTIELGYGLVHLVDDRRGSPLVARITGVRKQLSQAFGFVVPQFRVRDVR
jgi:flagellar biosynthesis protein FlhA